MNLNKLHFIIIPHPCSYPKKPWKAFVNDKNEKLITDEGIDLLDKMLQYDHQLRPTCREAMMHPFFATIREEERQASMNANQGDAGK